MHPPWRQEVLALTWYVGVGEHLAVQCIKERRTDGYRGLEWNSLMTQVGSWPVLFGYIIRRRATNGAQSCGDGAFAVVA